ncbi:hypothetical protein AURDEDRAFT_164914 [Auricularia subglabra TFB-10046 SS5]|nr:hypothetical protein AURDEDRAFT_164914 [Auricularia subglabra TFB-10046 SS5]
MRDLQLSLRLENQPSPPRFSFEGVTLRKLKLRVYNSFPAGPVVLTGTDMSGVPDIEHFGSAIAWSDPLWHRTDDGPIKVSIIWRSVCNISIFIRPEHFRWRRVYNREDWSSLPAEFPILRLPGLHARLAYLRMDNTLLPNLLECAGLPLGALRTLQIDLRPQAPTARMIWPPDWLRDPGRPDLRNYSFTDRDRSAQQFSGTSYCYVECAALERLTLFAMSKEISVESREVAFLGRALSQCVRLAQDRAALELFGVELHAPVAQALLDQTFSEVRQHEFVGEDSVPGRDDGLWDQEPRP